MAGARAMSMVTARRRIFEISFDEYVGTLNGIFNVLEVGGGLVVYMVGGGPQETGPQRCLTGTAFTYWFNGLFMILSSFLSAASAQILPVLFYYVLFGGTAAVFYIIAAVMVFKEKRDSSLQPAMGIITGGLHAAHCMYVTYKLYIEK